MSQVSQLLKAVRSGLLLAGLLSCGCGRHVVEAAGSDAGGDAFSDVAGDAGSDAISDVTGDAGSDAISEVTGDAGGDAISDVGGDAGSDAGKDAVADAGSIAPVLPPDRELTCPGPHYPDAGTGGYHGSCCEHVVCRAEPLGGCPKGNDGRGYGSGTCLCGAGEQIKGPYTIAEDDPKFAVQRQQGPCCYITTSIACDGRPLHVAEDVRVAPIVARRDWC